ncbi:hypothetical protein AAFF_G00213040 [Aldrovandia affinis]|uniref:Uncharacterized protein n=1 Tax=Aldrovandia affinis TaxID=143900 RepID=A0AAD7RH32_9TELE|nr:hypothetical protein AAFF_G00213040 [Aldrovandia affinis]
MCQLLGESCGLLNNQGRVRGAPRLCRSRGNKAHRRCLRQAVGQYLRPFPSVFRALHWDSAVPGHRSGSGIGVNESWWTGPPAIGTGRAGPPGPMVQYSLRPPQIITWRGSV